MCQVADKSPRPQSVLKTTISALQHLYNALDQPIPLTCEEITLLKSVLVKSGAAVPMSKSVVIPFRSVSAMFLSWEPNEKIPIKQLRLKAITLLALNLMLRPSDIVLKSMMYNPSVFWATRTTVVYYTPNYVS